MSSLQSRPVLSVSTHFLEVPTVEQGKTNPPSPVPTPQQSGSGSATPSRRPSFIDKLASPFRKSPQTTTADDEERSPLLGNDPEKEGGVHSSSASPGEPNTKASAPLSTASRLKIKFFSKSDALLSPSHAGPSSDVQRPETGNAAASGTSTGYERMFTNESLTMEDILGIWDFGRDSVTSGRPVTPLAFQKQDNESDILSDTASYSKARHDIPDFDAASNIESLVASSHGTMEHLGVFIRQPSQQLMYAYARYFAKEKGFSPELAELGGRLCVQTRVGLVALCQKSKAGKNLTAEKLATMLTREMPQDFEGTEAEFYSANAKHYLEKLGKRTLQGTVAAIGAKVMSLFQVIDARKQKLLRIVKLEQRHEKLLKDLIQKAGDVYRLKNSQDRIGNDVDDSILETRILDNKSELEELAWLCESLYLQRMNLALGGSVTPPAESEEPGEDTGAGRPSLQVFLENDEATGTLAEFNARIVAHMSGEKSEESLEDIVAALPPAIRTSLENMDIAATGRPRALSQ